jgi:hypothetical protein
VDADERGIEQKLGDEIAVTHRVQTVFAHARKAQFAREEFAINAERVARERACAQRQNRNARYAIVQARAITREHPKVRQQPVREQNRLRALQVRVTGHQHVEVLLSLFDECRLEIGELRLETRDRIEDEEARVGSHLIVAAAPGVQLARDRADEFTQAAFDGGVDVFVTRLRGECAECEFLFDLCQTFQQRVAFGLADEIGARERTRVRATTANVHLVQSPVEAKRRVEVRKAIVH